MADCQLSGPSRPTTKDIATIPEGRVGQVCKEWLIREDGNLAYHLQNEEIREHYEDNRSKNRIVRQDLPLAKHLQHTELLEARRARERRLRLETESDETLAKQIERRLRLEEQNEKKSLEEEDEKLAKKLLEKEKAKQMKKRLQKERQQVEKLSEQIGADYFVHSNTDTLASTSDFEANFSRQSYQRILTEDDQELDLSEFCMPPPPGLTPEELKYFLEEQDAEIARLLQQQELKRSKHPEKEKLAVIEAQDYEIAKMLQKQEKERVRRIKEKLRQRQRQQQEFQRTSTPISPQTSPERAENLYDIPENHLVSGDDETYEEPYQVLATAASGQRQSQNFYNIAMDLDPTYRRRTNQPVESSVDDFEDGCRVESQTSRSQDSLDLTHRTNRPGDTPVSHSTTSSRSSHGSSSSRQSNKSTEQVVRFPSIVDSNDDDYAPPLPPRDVSLRGGRNESIIEPKINLLPPHHPQHPNRRNLEPNITTTTTSRYSPNQSSLYVPPSSVPIPGQRRMLSMEKQHKRDKHKPQDGCKTQ